MSVIIPRNSNGDHDIYREHIGTMPPMTWQGYGLYEEDVIHVLIGRLPWDIPHVCTQVCNACDSIG